MNHIHAKDLSYGYIICYNRVIIMQVYYRVYKSNDYTGVTHNIPSNVTSYGY